MRFLAFAFVLVACGSKPVPIEPNADEDASFGEREWDASVPEGFEVGISIGGADSIPAIGRAIANALGASVVHHRGDRRRDCRLPSRLSSTIETVVYHPAP